MAVMAEATLTVCSALIGGPPPPGQAEMGLAARISKHLSCLDLGSSTRQASHWLRRCPAAEPSEPRGRARHPDTRPGPHCFPAETWLVWSWYLLDVADCSRHASATWMGNLKLTLRHRCSSVFRSPVFPHAWCRMRSSNHVRHSS